MLLKSDLRYVIEWALTNNMTLHKDKFDYMCHKFNKYHTLLELSFVMCFIDIQCLKIIHLNQCISYVILAF